MLAERPNGEIARSRPKWRSVGLIVAGLAFTIAALTAESGSAAQIVHAALALVSFGLAVYWLVKYPSAPWI